MFKHLKQLTSLFAMIAVLFAFTTEAMAKKSKTLKNTQKKGFVRSVSYTHLTLPTKRIV